MRNKGSQVWITTGKVSPLIPFGKYAKRPIVRNKGSQVYNGEGVTPLVSFGKYAEIPRNDRSVTKYGKAIPVKIRKVRERPRNQLTKNQSPVSA